MSLLQDHVKFQYLATCSFETFFFTGIIDNKKKETASTIHDVYCLTSLVDSCPSFQTQ